MSRLDNNNSLEKQLADLQLKNNNHSTNKIKKIPPAVPPKNKAQPQIPHSVSVNTLPEPSYSSRIYPISNNNIHGSYISSSPGTHKDYVNVNRNPPQGIPKKQIPVNSKVPTYRNSSDELPPPPPPPLPNLQQHNYDLITEIDDYLPAPPSPVSSNYSELIRAASNLNNYNQERPNFAPIYQNEYPAYGTSQASTYESLYEPINPRPQSNHSTQTMTSINCNRSQQHSESPLHKEEEVDALTNLLVKSISDGQEPDIFGVCVKCNDKVVEASGCTAMGNMYHVKCFCCQYCNINLQGKAFYDVEGYPYCETDYLETLEKCSVCEKPILDRILRATGKPYHPTCFTCVVCGKSLDGIPFTVDAMNQIHCIDDFHKKFAPRCCVCEFPIMPEDGQEETVRIVALDRSFHVRCYRCEDCGLLLSSEAEGRGCYPLDNHILCKTCNAHRIRQLTNVMTTDL